jgi:hypothetical protein
MPFPIITFDSPGPVAEARAAPRAGHRAQAAGRVGMMILRWRMSAAGGRRHAGAEQIGGF